MSVSTSGRTWEDASSPAAVQLVRRFEGAWRDSSGSGRHPTPDEFLGESGSDCPGARLALLRADLALRREAGEAVDASWYRDRYPDLESETLVALIYEEFCLREEDGEAPDPADYLARFPDVAPQLRRVLDIHGLVGSGQTTISHAAAAPPIPFPEAGQTIAGFHLVEELGRGAFARVFRAEERQLADRPVALKVARAGSREPQTLARLQHTHIVPVHSTRTDPATGLHLLCMPYFGRITLARLLADPKVQVARHGSDLIAALDRLEPQEGQRVVHTAGRSALALRSYAQAIAWWGARMAEALEHAHDRGVLHRDIKPSNVLVTGDGMPMLLDFNLARESLLDNPEQGPDTLGGTLDYMAPEHLEALADGLADRVDSQSDIYGLGVVLYESLMGERPFTTPRGARSAVELLLKAADERRVEAPWLRDSHPEVPPPLEAVVRRCLAPEPEDRYASAGELAHDLQAVADNRPLKYTKEPLNSRVIRWVRRNHRSLVAATPIIIALMIAAVVRDNANKFRSREEATAKGLNDQGEKALADENFNDAITNFKSARQISKDKPYLLLAWKRASQGEKIAEELKRARDNADQFFKEAEPLRFHLTGFLGDPTATFPDAEKALRLFYVLERDDWMSLPEFKKLLDQPRQNRLLKEVTELLFLLAVAEGNSPSPKFVQNALRVCDKALVFANEPGPWLALRERFQEKLGQKSVHSVSTQSPATETSALACFEWGYLRKFEKQYDQALVWFRRAVEIEPSDYWHHFYLAFAAHSVQRYDEAREHYNTAVALNKHSPWIYQNRGQLYREQQNWGAALHDLDIAFEGFAGKPERKLAQFERGFVRQQMGDLAGARRDYDTVIADPVATKGHFARLNRAELYANSGAVDKAFAEYDAMVAMDAKDIHARMGRSLVNLRQGRMQDADADLTEILLQTEGHDDVTRAQAFSSRAMTRLILGHPVEAEADAAAAYRIEPIPSHDRLWARTLLALGRIREVKIDRPETFANLPIGGAPLRANLRAAVEILGPDTTGGTATSLRALQTRALLLAALNDPQAEREANRAVMLAPLSAQAHLIRARVRYRLGNRAGALEDTKAGLELQPENSRLWELRGILDLEMGRALAALTDLNRAMALGGGELVFPARAKALMARGDATAAVREWTYALRRDPEDPHAFLGRSRAYRADGRIDRALADLEQAAAWAGDRPALIVRIAAEGFLCLPGHPDQLPRVMALTRRAWGATKTSWTPRPH